MMFTIVNPFTVPAKKLSEFESCSWTERDWSDGKRQRGRGRKTCIVRRNRCKCDGECLPLIMSADS